MNTAPLIYVPLAIVAALLALLVWLL